MTKPDTALPRISDLPPHGALVEETFSTVIPRLLSASRGYRREFVTELTDVVSGHEIPPYVAPLAGALMACLSLADGPYEDHLCSSCGGLFLTDAAHRRHLRHTGGCDGPPLQALASPRAEVQQLVRQVVEAFSCVERTALSERTKAGLREARSRGVRLGRPPIIGSSVIRSIAQLRSNGRTWREVAEFLNAKGVPTAHGAPAWSAATARYVYMGRTTSGKTNLEGKA